MAVKGNPNHASVLNEDEIEWMQDTPDSMSRAMALELAEAEEFADDDTIEALYKIIRSFSAAGRRVGMVFEIAKNEEAAQTVAELTVGKRGV